MNSWKRNSWILIAAGIALGWFGGRFWEPATAQAGVAGAGATPELVAFASDLSSGGQALYLIDPKTKVLSVYEFDAKKSKLKLAAIRHYAADHQLSEFNNEQPFVADIEQLIKKR